MNKFLRFTYSFLIVGVLYFVLKRNINQPISELTDMAEEIGRGNLNVQIHLNKPKEFLYFHIN